MTPPQSDTWQAEMTATLTFEGDSLSITPHELATLRLQPGDSLTVHDLFIRVGYTSLLARQVRRFLRAADRQALVIVQERCHD